LQISTSNKKKILKEEKIVTQPLIINFKDPLTVE